ncbi:hypothetical protein RQV27_004739, partial [Escherichia coli]|nr:hypothetical protein [Escherichia coli]
TEADKISGVSTTYDLITQNPHKDVTLNAPNVYAVCVE